MTKHDQDATNQIMASLDQAGNMEIDIDNCKSPPGELADTEKPAEEGSAQQPLDINSTGLSSVQQQAHFLSSNHQIIPSPTQATSLDKI